MNLKMRLGTERDLDALAQLYDDMKRIPPQFVYMRNAVINI